MKNVAAVAMTSATQVFHLNHGFFMTLNENCKFQIAQNTDEGFKLLFESD